MSKEIIWSALGTIFGSLIEEGVEEVFPGLGELGVAGEVSGFIAGLLGSKLLNNEAKKAFENFITYAYRTFQKGESDKITGDEINKFSEYFKALPQQRKKEIVNNFKKLDPYSYSFINEFFEQYKGE